MLLMHTSSIKRKEKDVKIAHRHGWSPDQPFVITYVVGQATNNGKMTTSLFDIPCSIFPTEH